MGYQYPVISPLAFLNYDETIIYDTIKDLGWEKPKDTDPNSSNCLLNSYANVIHKQKYGFHPCTFEMAKLVREGYLERGEALSRLVTEEDQETLRYIQKKLTS